MRRLVRFALVGLLALLVVTGCYFWLSPAYSQTTSDNLQIYQDWIAQNGQIVIASQPNNAPFYFTSDGSLYNGFDQELVSALEMALGADIMLVPMSLQDARSALSRHEIDGIMGQEPSPDLSPFCAFSQPYLSNAQAIFVTQDRADIHNLTGLAQRTVTVVSDSPGAYLVRSNASINVLPTNSTEEALNRLLTGEAEAFVGDELSTRNVIQRNNLQAHVKIVGEPLRRKGYTVAVHKGNKELLGLLNYGLSAVETSGVKDKLSRRWFGTDVLAAESSPRNWLPIAAGVALALSALSAALYSAWRSTRRKMDDRGHRLHESEQRQRVLIDNINDAIFSIHPSDTSILEANRKAEQLTGYRRESLLHMRLSDLFPSDTRDQSLGKLQEVLLNGSGNFDDLVFVCRDSTRLDVDVSASVIEYDRRKVVQILARDITEKKAMGRELVRRNRNLTTLNKVAATVSRSLELDEMLDEALDMVLDVVGADMGAIYLFDEETGSLVLRVYRGDPPVLTVRTQSFGEPDPASTISASNGNAAQLAGAWWPQSSQFHLGSFVSSQLKAKDKLLGVMNVASQEQRRFTQDDVALLTAVANQISIAIESAMLFSDLRTAIGDLFVIKQFNDNVLQSMSNGLITVDMSGRITSANVAAARIIGYSKENLLGRPAGQMLVSSNGFDCILSETMQKGIPCSNCETVLTHRDGHEIPIGLNTSPLRDNQGVMTGVLLVFSDQSEMKKMEEEKRRRDRLADVGEMSAVIAHELRNPLGTISTGVQVLARQTADSSVRNEVQMILDATERINLLMENVLMISKPLALNLCPAHAPEVVEGVVARVQGKAAEKRVRIQKNYAPDVGPSLLDKLRLDQALTNLMSNALDAMPDGGDLRISVRKVRLLPEPSTALRVLGKDSEDMIIGPQEWIRMEVADTGIGIPPDRIDSLFEPFKTTKEKRKGTGLGLAIAKRIIDDHGGRISVRSREGVGTVFTIDLPLAA